MEYTKKTVMAGEWVKGSAIKSGIKAKLVSEATRRESLFKNDDGTAKMQDVAKIRFEDTKEPMNIALNRATIDGLIEAFGTESKAWMDKLLITHTEKMIVGGKRVTALYLVPEGFEVAEDENGYMTVKKVNTDGLTSAGTPVPFPDEEEPISPFPDEEEPISPSEIPF